MSAKERRLVKRYSAAFKQQVVSEIERGEISVAEARKRYDIGGTMTIDKWLRKMGKLSLLATVVRIEMPHDVDRIKALEQQIGSWRTMNYLVRCSVFATPDAALRRAETLVSA